MRPNTLWLKSWDFKCQYESLYTITARGIEWRRPNIQGCQIKLATFCDQIIGTCWRMILCWRADVQQQADHQQQQQQRHRRRQWQQLASHDSKIERLGSHCRDWSLREVFFFLSYLKYGESNKIFFWTLNWIRAAWHFVWKISRMNLFKTDTLFCSHCNKTTRTMEIFSWRIWWLVSARLSFQELFKMFWHH